MTMLQVLGFQIIATVVIIIRLAIISSPNDSYKTITGSLPAWGGYGCTVQTTNTHHRPSINTSTWLTNIPSER